MMKPVLRIDAANADACIGRPVLDGKKVAWNGGLLGSVLLFGPLTFSWDALLLFAILTYATLLLGHSVGMHRMMIHRTFRCAKPVERLLIYLGTLVGVAGPFGVIAVHDTRDWAQRQARCHDFFAHRRSYLRDLSWQLFYRFEFVQPPVLTIEPQYAADPFYRFLEKTWRWQQAPLAVVLFMLGGWGWVVWGVCARVAASTIGHWSITYFCHRPGHGAWDVAGASVQASNLPGLGWLTCGEAWHNNHHAFPESARIGIHAGQSDPGWLIILAMENAGWASAVGRPRGETDREDLAPRASDVIAPPPDQLEQLRQRLTSGLEDSAAGRFACGGVMGSMRRARENQPD